MVNFHKSCLISNSIMVAASVKFLPFAHFLTSWRTTACGGIYHRSCTLQLGMGISDGFGIYWSMMSLDTASLSLYLYHRISHFVTKCMLMQLQALCYSELYLSLWKKKKNHQWNSTTLRIRIHFVSCKCVHINKSYK